MSYCDTCGHQFSDICGTCESLDGVPIQYSPKPSDVRPIKDDGIIGTFDYATGNFTPVRKMTNADRIRHMTDEELAEYLNEEFHVLHWCDPPELKIQSNSDFTICSKEPCEKCTLEWLKQEAT